MVIHGEENGATLRCNNRVLDLSEAKERQTIEKQQQKQEKQRKETESEEHPSNRV